MRRIVSLAAAAAILASLTVAGVASGAKAPPVYSTAVTVDCDTAIGAMKVSVRFYTDAGLKREKFLDVNGIAGQEWGVLQCVEGDPADQAATFTTKGKPTNVTVWYEPGCGAVTFPMPTSVLPGDVCGGNARNVRVTVSTPVRG